MILSSEGNLSAGDQISGHEFLLRLSAFFMVFEEDITSTAITALLVTLTRVTVELDEEQLSSMCKWSEAQIRDFFESGGEDVPLGWEHLFDKASTTPGQGHVEAPVAELASLQVDMREKLAAQTGGKGGAASKGAKGPAAAKGQYGRSPLAVGLAGAVDVVRRGARAAHVCAWGVRGVRVRRCVVIGPHIVTREQPVVSTEYDVCDHLLLQFAAECGENQRCQAAFTPRS